MHSNIKPIVDESNNIQGKSMQKLNSSTPELEVDNEDEDDEEAQAEAEEYANISLIEVSVFVIIELSYTIFHCTGI